MAKKQASHSRRFWLFKSEPESFSIADLAKAPQQTTFWDGIRNYQARNFLRDDVQLGDRVLFYHSNSDPMAIVGICEVVRTGYPDHSAFDPQSKYYDEKTDPNNPAWYMVDIKLLQQLKSPLTRDQLKDAPELKDMMLLKKGSRLSIQPVARDEFLAILKLSGARQSLAD